MPKWKPETGHDLSAHMEIQLESFVVQLFAKLNIPGDLTSSDQPLHPEGDTSSNSQNFQSHHFQHDLRLPRVDVNKFDGSDPTGWVTQMEHYFSLHGITMSWPNSVMVFSIWILNIGNGGNGVKRHAKGMWLGHSLLQRFMTTLM
jgi:hypothetical protein